MKHSLFSRKERRILRYIIWVVFATRILLAFRSEEAIYTRPFIDDSFYVFNCSEHLAHGDGFSIDGIHPTNGVQPLIVIIYAPLFLIAGADKLLALQLSFILIALFDSISVLYIARIIRLLQKNNLNESPTLLSPPVIAAILWASLYPIMVHTVNGLETGVYSCMLLVSLSYYIGLCRLRKNAERIRLMQWILLGIVLGLTVLARIDAVFLVVTIACYELLILKRKGLPNAIILSLIAFIVSSPWWWYNYHLFGSLMPQSGFAESLDNTIWMNILNAELSLGDIGSLFFFLPNYAFPSWFDFLWLSVIIAILFFVSKKFKIWQHLKATYNLALLKPIFLFCSMIFVFYLLFFGAPYFLPRYFHPLRILYLILFSCSLPEILRHSRILYAHGRKVGLYACYTIGICALLFSGAKYVSLFIRAEYSDLYRMGKWALLHPNDPIGMSQSGVASFVSPNILNLDGKVNFEALEANRHHSIGNYIESKKLGYLADWRGIAEQLVLAATTSGGGFEKFDSIGRVIIFKRK